MRRLIRVSVPESRDLRCRKRCEGEATHKYDGHDHMNDTATHSSFLSSMVSPQPGPEMHDLRKTLSLVVSRPPRLFEIIFQASLGRLQPRSSVHDEQATYSLLPTFMSLCNTDEAIANNKCTARDLTKGRESEIDRATPPL